MICSLLIMTIVFVNGLVNAEQKAKHSGTILREEEMDPKTKAWWMMVESGKVGQEELKRITPKSIFIAPLLANRAGKCKEGYSHDHLGQCVKIIKIDPKAQLELLLKRLNMLYGEKKKDEGGEEEEGVEEEEEEEEEEEAVEERPIKVSNEPLHFSIPINEGARVKDKEKLVNGNSENMQSPQARLCFNETKSFLNHTYPPNFVETTEIELLNETQPWDLDQGESSGSGSGSGSSSGNQPPDEDEIRASTVRVISEEIDMSELIKKKPTTDKLCSSTEDPSETQMQWTAEIEMHSEMTTERCLEMCSTPIPNRGGANSAESYQSVTEMPSANDGGGNLAVKILKVPKLVKNNPESQRIHFPSDGEVRTRVGPQPDTGYIRFPDQPSRERPSYQSPQLFSNWNPQYQIHPGAIPRQQFWWLPENWKVDENQQKSSLVKFWSRLPLIHDISYAEDRGEKPFPARQPQAVASLRRNHDFPNFNHQTRATRRGKPFRSNRFQDSVAVPRQTFRIQR